MLNFNYYTPTRIVFGKEAEQEVGSLVKAAGGSKVLLHYGGQSAARSGLLDRVRASLKEAGIDFTQLGGVVPNPRLSKVHEGMELCRAQGVDFILALGGGSVIDSAKAIGLGVANDRDPWDYFEGKGEAEACLPIGAVLTIAAAGSEMSSSTIITKEEGWHKRGYGSDLIRPLFAVLNPQLTVTLPDYQTQSGCTDILMHTIERYFNASGTMDMTRQLSVALLKVVMHHAVVLLDDPDNYESRAEVMWAGSLSHNGLTECGNDGGDWATHRLEHELGGLFDVAHGAGLAALWASWARYVYEEDVALFASFGREVMDVPLHLSDREAALAGIDALEAFLRSLGMPTSIEELGVDLTEAQILEMADRCSLQETITVGAVKKLKKEDMAAIYRMAR